MSDDTENHRMVSLLHIDDVRMAIDSALTLIDDARARDHLERAKGSLAKLDEIISRQSP